MAVILRSPCYYYRRMGYYTLLNVYKRIPQYGRILLAGLAPEHCQSQSVNKAPIGCWPVRNGLSEKKAITGPAVSRHPCKDDERG